MRPEVVVPTHRDSTPRLAPLLVTLAVKRKTEQLAKMEPMMEPAFSSKRADRVAIAEGATACEKPPALAWPGVQSKSIQRIDCLHLHEDQKPTGKHAASANWGSCWCGISRQGARGEHGAQENAWNATMHCDIEVELKELTRIRPRTHSAPHGMA